MAGNPFLAMVALEDSAAPEIERIGNRLQQRWPDAPPMAAISQRGLLSTFQIGETAVALTHFPRPIAWQYLEGPCACAWYWPEAAEAMSRHRSHLLFHLLDQELRPIALSQLLTRLVAAALEECSATGVLWGPSRLVHPRAAFVELAHSMAETELPLYLWVDFRVEAEDNGQLRLFTTGLEALGQMEIEVTGFEGDVGELRASVYNVAHYALEGKKPINQGQSLGTEGGRRMIAHYAPSLVDANQEVMRLEFED